MAWCEVGNSRRIWYEDQGTGEPVVLLHGWCMSSLVWDFQAGSLSRECRVIRPDFAGHGASDHPVSEECSFERLADDLEQLFERLDLRRVLLVGWSMGGEVALRFCSRSAARVAALVLVGATPRFQAAADFPHGLPPMEVEGMALKLRRNMSRALSGFRGLMFAPGEFSDQTSEAKVLDLLGRIPLPAETVALGYLRSLAGEDLRELLPAITLPTLVVNGSLDRICLPGASVHLAARIQDCTRIIMEGCGHAPFLTRPEEFNDWLIMYWRRLRGAG